MSENKMKILQRLESGELTATEALDMISQLRDQSTPPPAHSAGTSQFDRRQIDPHKTLHSHEGHGSNGYDNHFGEHYDADHHTTDWVDGIIGWVGGIVEDISASVKDTEVGANLSDLIGGTYGHHNRTEEFVSKPVLQGLVQLELSGKNESIEIYAYDGDCVQIRCDYDARRADSYVQFHDENGHVAIWFDEKAMRSVKLVCYVPRANIGHVHAATKNARIQVAGITAGEINISTKNDKILLESISCGNLTAITKNDKMKAIGISGENIYLETANDKITAADIHAAATLTLKTTNDGIKTSNIDAMHMVLSTTNSRIKMSDTLVNTSTVWEGERTLEAYTSNDGIKLSLPAGIGFSVEANTTDSKVTCEMPLNLLESTRKNRLVGESTDYAVATRRLRVRLGTTDGAIKILRA